MSHIVLITHVYDDFRNRKFLLGALARHWLDAGHDVAVTAGLDNWPAADAAIMHLDVSVVPEAYSQASGRYPVIVNAHATDIRKRHVSKNLVARDDGWTGPVIVKTDLNCGGLPEKHALERFHRDEKAADIVPDAVVSTSEPYPLLTSSKEVPDAVWNNQGLVVERFLPEHDAYGYWLRAWVFFGDAERCTRYCASDPVVKTAHVTRREPVQVPDELRAERERLGFDYGKFDFVVVDGKPILLDANRTPSAPPSGDGIDASNKRLADGLDALLTRAR